MLSIADVAKRLDISEQHARKLCRDGQLRAERVGKVWIVAEPALAAYHPRPLGRPRIDDGL